MPTPKHLSALEATIAQTQMPSDFIEFWSNQKKSIKQQPLTNCRPIKKTNTAAYSYVNYTGTDNAEKTATYIKPATKEPTAIMIDFHDIGRSTRGLYYLTRYIALGYAVFAPSITGVYAMANGVDKSKEDMGFLQVYRDALLAVSVAHQLHPNLPIYVSGEGIGGSLAILTAALTPQIQCCSALNPLMADFRTICDLNADTGFYSSMREYFRNFDATHANRDHVFKNLDYLDVVNFAALVQCPLLIGTGLISELSPPATQYAVYNNAVCQKRHALFQKYGHERINFYEDEHLDFLLRTNKVK